MAEHWFAGIDGGGSRCTARIVDAAGRALGEGAAGPANTRLGVEQTFAQIEGAARAALHAAGLPASALARLHAGAGLAGLNLASDRQAVLAHPHPFEAFTVETDVYIACLGAFEGDDGGVLVLGTGSVGMVIVDGRATSVGGWGFQLGDQGSGAGLGHRALRQALLAHEGVIASSALAERLLARFGSEPEGAVLWAATAAPADYGALAPLVAEMADDGEPLAVTLMRESGADASLLAGALIARGAGRLALCGGFAASVRPWLAPEVHARLVAPAGDPLDGAVRLARRARAERGDAR